MKSILSSAPSHNSCGPTDAAEAGDALRTLARGIRRAQSFALFFAVCNRPDERERWVAMLEQALPDLCLHRVQLASDTTDVLGEVERQVLEPKGPVLIFDLEQAVPSSLPQHEILNRLNLQRPEWKRRWGKAVVFWVPEYVLGFLEREAPDFFDWRSDTLTFPTLGSDELEQFRLLAWEPSVKRSLPKVARLARIQELRGRLAETRTSKDPVIRQSWFGWLRELAGHLAFTGEGVEEAVGLYREAIGISEELGDRHLRAIFLGELGRILAQQGDYDQALDFLQQSLAIVREVGDKQSEGMTLNHLSQIFKARSDYDRAVDCLEKSIAIHREIGDKQGEGAALNNLGQIFHARGDYNRALEYLQQSLAICREIGDKQDEGRTLNNLSQNCKARGNYDRALDYLQQSLAIVREVGDRRGEGTSLNNMGSLSHACGDDDRALNYLEQSLAIRREIGDRLGEGTTLNNLSQIVQAHGDYDRALDYLQQSLAIRREIGDLAGLCITLFNIGCIQAQKGATKEADATWIDVYRLAKKIDSTQALRALDDLAKKLGQPGINYWEQLAGHTAA